MSSLTSPPRPADAAPALTVIAAGLAMALTGQELTVEGTSRAFVPLLEGPTYEAWLIAWAPLGALELHDHGGSAGAIHVLRGELVETYTDRRHREPLRSRTVHAGHEVSVPAACVHEVWNAGPGDAVSVHVYSPRVTSMTFFDPDPAHFLTPLRTVATAGAEADEVERPR